MNRQKLIHSGIVLVRKVYYGYIARKPRIVFMRSSLVPYKGRGIGNIKYLNAFRH